MVFALFWAGTPVARISRVPSPVANLALPPSSDGINNVSVHCPLWLSLYYHILCLLSSEVLTTMIEDDAAQENECIRYVLT